MSGNDAFRLKLFFIDAINKKEWVVYIKYC